MTAKIVLWVTIPVHHGGAIGVMAEGEGGKGGKGGKEGKEGKEVHLSNFHSFI
jgi:hypothetical protein